VTFQSHKVVSTLPTTLTPDTIYLVRVSEGFDLYCSDATGAIAHKVNPSPSLDLEFQFANNPLFDSDSLWLDSNVSSGFNTCLISGNTLVLCPFYYYRNVNMTTVGVSVTQAVASGEAKFSIWSSNTDNSPNLPLTESSSFSTSTTGNKIVSLSHTLQERTLYWLGIRGNNTFRTTAGVSRPLMARTLDSNVYRLVKTFNYTDSLSSFILNFTTDTDFSFAPLIRVREL